LSVRNIFFINNSYYKYFIKPSFLSQYILEILLYLLGSSLSA